MTSVEGAVQRDGTLKTAGGGEVFALQFPEAFPKEVVLVKIGMIYSSFANMKQALRKAPIIKKNGDAVWNVAFGVPPRHPSSLIIPKKDQAAGVQTTFDLMGLNAESNDTLYVWRKFLHEAAGVVLTPTGIPIKLAPLSKMG